MSFFELLENTPKIFGFFGIFLLICTIAAFIFNFGFKFRIIGATIFSLLLSLSSWAFIQSYNEKIVAPIIRNLKPKLNIKAAMVQIKRNIPKNPKILGVCANSSKKDI